jgi:DNA recombination protein RmuC
MTNTLLIATLSTTIGMVVSYALIAYRNASAQRVLSERVNTLETELASRHAEYVARQDDSRKSLAESQKREAEAARRSQEAEGRLHAVLEERGQLKADLGRLNEIRSSVAERDQRLEVSSALIVVLEKAKTAAESEAKSAHERAISSIANEKEAASRIIAAKDEQIEKLESFIGTAREVLGTEFKALSSELLKNASDQLVKTTTVHSEHQKEQVAGMLKPVQATIERLDKHVTDSNEARQRAETLLDDQVKRLAGATEVLTSALKKPVVRGSWGEMQLENALENAGLEAELDYILQHSTDAEDGRKRTDAIINLPKGRKLIVDSKNLMESYYAYTAAEDPAEKAILAEVHAKSLKSHIKALSGKEYWRRYDGLDCVILFIPHDGMYHAAIRDESDLIREASDKRVFVANPMSLIPLLKAVRYVMDQDRLNKSAAEISAIGTDLYSEISRFAVNFNTLGGRLKATVNAFNSALPGLDRFILSKSRKLKQLGAAKGDEARLPDTVEVEVRDVSSNVLADLNPAALSQLLEDDEGSKGTVAI